MDIETIGTIERRRTIADLEPGETGWTVPWAFDFNDDGTVANIQQGAPINDYPGGDGKTTNAAVTLTRDGRYIVDLSRCDWYRR